MTNNLFRSINIIIAIFNLCAGIIGGIWLATLGQWKLIGIGIVLLLLVKLVYSLLIIPRHIFTLISIHYYENNRKLMYVFYLFSQFYLNLLMVGTCIIAFLICTSFYKGNADAGLVPFLLWSWGMALNPWILYQSKYPDNDYIRCSLFTISLTYMLIQINIFAISYYITLLVFTLLIFHIIIMPLYDTFFFIKTKKSSLF